MKPLRTGLLLVALALAGCASAPPAAAPAASGAQQVSPDAAALNPVDPWERWNRKVYAFNDGLDRAVLKPVAEGYRSVVPSLVRRGIDNVLGNIGDVWSTANNFLQGKFQVGFEMGMRVLTNTFFGLGGLLDPATEMHLTRRSADFGMTLGVWGIGNGPFVELPLFGPSTVRDTAGLVVDRQVHVAAAQLPETADGRYAVTGIQVVNARTKLLDAGNLVDNVALDPYAFIRDAYLATRRNAVYGGAPPSDIFEDPGDDAAPAAASASAPARAASAASTSPAAAAAASAASAPK